MQTSFLSVGLPVLLHALPLISPMPPNSALPLTKLMEALQAFKAVPIECAAPV